MKRILTLLLLLLLPCTALAETYGLVLSLDADEALLNQYIHQYMDQQADWDPVSEKITDTLIKLLNGASMELRVQEDAASVAIRLAEQPFLDLQSNLHSGQVYLTSSLLSGYALQDEGTDAENLEPSSVDWSAVMDSLVPALQSWENAVEPSVARGHFVGDAYEGGTECLTWMLTDKQLAGLISSLATPKMRHAAEPLLRVIGLDAEALFVRFDEENARVAKEDRFQYVLREVRNDRGEFVGASLTVLDDGVQVATLSLGATKKGFRLVAGLGMEAKNYWWEFTASRSQLRNITYFSGTSREWMADKEVTFSYGAQTNAPMSDLAWRMSLTESGSRFLWDGNISADDGIVVSFKGSYIPTGCTLDATISLGAAPYIPLKLDVDFGPTDAITPVDPALLKVISLSDPAGSLEKLILEGMNSLLEKLTNIIPEELLNLLPN